MLKRKLETSKGRNIDGRGISCVAVRCLPASLAVVIIATVCATAAGMSRTPTADEGAVKAAERGPVDRFMEDLSVETTIPAEAKELIRQTWAKCQDCDAEEFLTQGLALMSPEFRAGLDAYHQDRYQECAGIMGELRSDPRPFVATHAAVYEVKALVALERLLEAGERIEQLLGTSRDRKGAIRVDERPTAVAEYSYFAPEIAFLRGYCLLAGLQYDAAADALAEFLFDHPDASQRLLIAARQMRAELATRQPDQIGEVVDLMNYAGRRLTHGDSGETVQTRQERVVEILDQLIKEAEDQESSSSCSSGSGSSGQSPSRPMELSQLPGGSAKEGSLREGRRANPAEVWGSMPPAQRARILQALRDTFPSRYRQLVEQYYEQLAKKP